MKIVNKKQLLEMPEMTVFINNGKDFYGINGHLSWFNGTIGEDFVDSWDYMREGGSVPLNPEETMRDGHCSDENDFVVLEKSDLDMLIDFLIKCRDKAYGDKE